MKRRKMTHEREGWDKKRHHHVTARSALLCLAWPAAGSGHRHNGGPTGADEESMRAATSIPPFALCVCSSGGSSAFVVDVGPRQQSALAAAVTTGTSRRSFKSALAAAAVTAGDDSPTNNSHSRRSFLTRNAFGLVAGTTSLLVASAPPAAATLMDATQDDAKTFSPGTKLSVEDGKKRFSLARKEVQYLLDNYDDICQGGGDAVRRYLGTVGVASNMYGITKVVKDLRDEAEDLVEFTETANEFEAYLYQADGAAYQSLFVEHSSAKGTPASFLATAKKDAISMQRYMDDLARQLNL